MRHLTPTLVILAALAGCKTDEPDPPATHEGIGLRRMADCDELRERLVDVVTESAIGGGYWRGGAEPPMTDDAAEGGGDGDGGPTDFSGTNNQEEGVDELDLVKTDGEHLYIAQDRSLQIVDSWPADEAHLVATVPLDGWARGLFQTGPDTLVVLEDIYGQEDNDWYGAVRARVVDISDRANPSTTTTWDLQGWLSDARLTDDQVYLVVNQYMDLPDTAWEDIWNAAGSLRWPINGDEDDWEAAREDNRRILRPLVAQVLASVDMADVMPGVRQGDAAFSALHACEDLYAPDQVTPMGLLTVAQLDPAATTLSATGLMADGWTVYASTAALYVAQTSQWWWGWSGDGESHIHRFELGGAEPTYTGSGAVTGWLYDQFALSEYDGNLRVVTTDFGWWGGVGVAVDVGVEEDVPDEADGGDAGGGGGDVGEEETPPEGDTDEPDEPEETPDQPANHVYVLDASTGGDMPVIGHVGGIAPGETVQAVRMMGDKGYVITFRQTDPLFTLDLSDPTAPAVLGELHMPGYSAYLHPLDDTHLIGVGMAGLDTGELTGLAIHLFDVSDLSSPQLIDSYELDPGDQSWGWSEAMWDHHAFTFHRGVLTIPMYTWSWDEVGGYTGFSGTVSLAVDTNGVTELGRVDHHDLVADSVCIWDELWAYEGDDKPRDEGDDVGDTDVGDGGDETPPDEGEEPTDETWSYCDWDYGYWYASVRRSVYIEDNLFTISNYGVKINDLNDPATDIGRVLFYPDLTE